MPLPCHPLFFFHLSFLRLALALGIFLHLNALFCFLPVCLGDASIRPAWRLCVRTTRTCTSTSLWSTQPSRRSSGASQFVYTTSSLCCHFYFVLFCSHARIHRLPPPHKLQQTKAVSTLLPLVSVDRHCAGSITLR